MAKIVTILNASLMLQALQALSISYLALPIALYIYCFLKLRLKDEFLTGAYISALAFLIMKIYVVLISLSSIETKMIILAMARDFFTFPLFFISYYLIKSSDDFKKIVKGYVVVVFLASLSLVYQQLFGAIEWLDAKSFRGGLDRYSSLLGAMPIFGVAGAFALILIDMVKFRKLFYSVIILCITTGMILTLQKAAIANLIIVTLIKVFSNSRNIYSFLRTIVALILVISVMYLLLVSIFPDFIRISLLLTGIPQTGDNTYVGNDFTTDLSKRLTGGQIVSISSQDVFTGLGYIGGGGIYGLDSGHSGHNGIIDLLLVGGLLNLTIFASIMVLSTVNLYNLKASNAIDRNMYLYLRNFLIVFMINLPVFSGILVNPSLSGILWLTLGYVARPKLSSQIKINSRRNDGKAFNENPKR